MFGPLLDVQMSFRVARDCAPCQEGAKHEGFVACPKTMAGVGPLKRICKFIRDVMRSGHWFPGKGCILEHQIVRFGKMILCDRRSTRMTWHHFFVDRWNGKITKRIGTRPSALHSTFYYWRKSRRIASFLMLPTSNVEELSQNCFVSDIVKRKNWGSLAELLRFQACRKTDR